MHDSDLWHIPAIDQHAHNLLRPEAVEAGPYGAFFTEGNDPAMVGHHARHTLFYRRSLRNIAALLECEPEERAILARRAELGLERLTGLCFDQSKLDTVLLDDGFLPEKTLPLDWHGRFVPVRRILRLEYAAELIIRESDGWEAGGFDPFIERFLGLIDPPPPEVVAFKSIAAYRSGLRINCAPEKSHAGAAFDRIRSAAGSKPVRLTEKALIDYLIVQALRVASRRGIPLQFHTGFGDRDLDLRLADPLHLRPVLEEKQWRRAPIVLLHASYPFVKEAGYLASVYPQVYLDFGLTVPYLSTAGMRQAVKQLLELAPYTKVMFSTDAHAIPELYYLGAKWGRETLAHVLEDAIRGSDLTFTEAERIAGRILFENARRLYLEPKRTGGDVD
jgi:predicted TIM-barrel fold metal-dependent hydrolase